MYTESLPSPNTLRLSLPLLEKEQNFVFDARTSIRNILTGKDSRMLLCIGPCSIHNIDSFVEFALLFKEMMQEFSSKFYCVLRAYFEKPRTNGGWPGFLYDPFLDNSCAMATGISIARNTLLEITKNQIPIVMEFVDPLTGFYLDDIVSFVCIGARTVMSPVHRRLASNLPCAVGFKNSLSGSLEDAIYGMAQAATSHTFMGINSDGKISTIRSRGNSYSTLILRGGMNGPNYNDDSIEKATRLLQKYNLSPKIIIDCAHGNSNKSAEKQIGVFESIIERKVLAPENPIQGIFVESYLKNGNQNLSSSIPSGDISITDPCLDWNSTYNLIKESYLKLSPIKSAIIA